MDEVSVPPWWRGKTEKPSFRGGGQRYLLSLPSSLLATKNHGGVHAEKMFTLLYFKDRVWALL
jgi:hypothetical protein